jgi:23S rRNA (guanine745-N1)-methyltransferase
MFGYQCPLCQSPLSQAGGYWLCSNNHRFDCAREGYVNLLPVQFKRSKIPGDSLAMMQARRAFLDAGYYQKMRDRVMALICARQTPQPARWLDIGCGEGYYTSVLAELLTSRCADNQVYGLDIAKTAVRAASKRYPRVNFCVASSQRLPFMDNALDGMLRIYAPCQPVEMQRVSFVVTVAPGPRHLLQLKERIYPQAKLHPWKDEHMPGFSLAGEEQLRFDMVLPGEAAGALLQMTPFAWRASQEAVNALIGLAEFPCETDFVIRVWRRDVD